MAMSIKIVARGWSLPIGINRWRAENAHPFEGKADPIWDTALESKWPKPIEPGFVQPIGTAKTLDAMGAFVSRVAEIEAIAATQFMELPTYRDLFAANGLPVISSSLDDDESDTWESLSERHRSTLSGDLTADEHYIDPEQLAARLRRIELEKASWPNGPTRKARLTTKNGQLAIEEVNGRTPDITFLKNALQTFISAYDALPTAEELDNMRARAAFYENKPVLAELTPDELHAIRSKDKSLDFLYGQDSDPRTGFADIEETTQDFDGLTQPDELPCWSCGVVLGHAGFDGEPLTFPPDMAPGEPTFCKAENDRLRFGQSEQESVS